MNLTLLFITLGLGIGISGLDIAPNLRKNKLRFEYGVLFKYNAKIIHNIPRAYVVTSYKIPQIKDLKSLQPLKVSLNCSEFKVLSFHFELSQEIRHNCLSGMEIMNLMIQRQKIYNDTVYNYLEKELPSILPKFPDRPKRGIFTFLTGGLIGMAVEGVKYFIHQRRMKAMRKAYEELSTKQNIQKNQLYQYKQDLLLYGKYSIGTTDEIIDGLNLLHNRTIQQDALFHNWTKREIIARYNNENGRRLIFDFLKYIHMYHERYLVLQQHLIEELEGLMNAIRILSRGYIPINLIPPTQLLKMIAQVEETVQKTDPEYELAIKNPSLYYDLKLASYGIDKDNNLLMQFPVWLKERTHVPLTLMEIETVKVPIHDENDKANSYTEVEFEKPYMAVSNESYISLRIQELRQCHKVADYYFCEELFLVKHKSKYSCESALYFNLSQEIVKRYCTFKYYFNTTVTPAVLDNGDQIVLANLAPPRKLSCDVNNEIGVPLPDHDYVLVNRSILCRCKLESDLTYLLPSLAPCPSSQSPQLVFYFTINRAFYQYYFPFWNKTELSEIALGITTQRQTLPVYLEDYTPKQGQLMKKPTKMRQLVRQIEQKESNPEIFSSPNGKNDGNNEEPFENFWLDNVGLYIFLFCSSVVAILSFACVFCVICKQGKMKSLVSSLALQAVKPKVVVDALQMNENSSPDTNITCNCRIAWWTILMLALSGIGIVAYVVIKMRKLKLLRGESFTNTCRLYLFISDIKYYVPLKLCKVTGSIPLMKIQGMLSEKDVTLKGSLIWDVLELNWTKVKLRLGEKEIKLPNTISVPQRERMRIRRMLGRDDLSFHIMGKVHFNWYTIKEDECARETNAIEE